MNDRYLYKAKRLDNGEWVEGFYYESNISGAYILQCKTKVRKKDGVVIGDDVLPFEIDPSTTCQCTGLPDKNGVKIFEGDIFLAGHYKWKCKVVWDEKCARFIGLTNDKDARIVYVDMVDRNNESAVEVVGNVYDNPELLEV